MLISLRDFLVLSPITCLHYSQICMESTNCMIIITVTIVDTSYHVKCITKLGKQLWQYFPIMQVVKD